MSEQNAKPDTVMVPPEDATTEELLISTGLITRNDAQSRRNFEMAAGYVSRNAVFDRESAQRFKDSVDRDHRSDMTVMQVALARWDAGRLIHYLDMWQAYEDAAMSKDKLKDATLSEIYRGLEYIMHRTEKIREHMGDLAKLPPITINIENLVQDNRQVSTGLDLSNPSERETIRKFFRELRPALQQLVDDGAGSPPLNGSGNGSGNGAA